MNDRLAFIIIRFRHFVDSLESYRGWFDAKGVMINHLDSKSLSSIHVQGSCDAKLARVLSVLPTP